MKSILLFFILLPKILYRNQNIIIKKSAIASAKEFLAWCYYLQSVIAVESSVKPGALFSRV